MVRALTVFGLLAIAAIGGCKEDPSFRMRWDVAGETLSDTTQCAEHGMFDVVAFTFDELGFLADASRYPCFPGSFDNPDATVGGPTLPPGNYAVKLVFSDGHDSGIFSWAYLRELCETKEAKWEAYLQKLHDAKASRDPDQQVVKFFG